jgi:hypothetical protein
MERSSTLPGSISPVARRHTCSRFPSAAKRRRQNAGTAALSVSDRISRVPDRQVSPASRKRTCSIWRSLMARAQSSNTSSNAGAPPRTATHQADYSVAARAENPDEFGWSRSWPSPPRNPQVLPCPLRARREEPPREVTVAHGQTIKIRTGRRISRWQAGSATDFSPDGI